MTATLVHTGIACHRLVVLANAVAFARLRLAAADREMMRHNKIYAKCKCGLPWVCPQYRAAVEDVDRWARQLRMVQRFAGVVW